VAGAAVVAAFGASSREGTPLPPRRGCAVLLLAERFWVRRLRAAGFPLRLDQTSAQQRGINALPNEDGPVPGR